MRDKRDFCLLYLTLGAAASLQHLYINHTAHLGWNQTDVPGSIPPEAGLHESGGGPEEEGGSPTPTEAAARGSGRGCH